MDHSRAGAEVVPLDHEGIFLVTFGMCAKVLLCGRDQLVLKRARDINWGMLAVAMLMFIFATFDGEYVVLTDEQFS